MQETIRLFMSVFSNWWKNNTINIFDISDIWRYFPHIFLKDHFQFDSCLTKQVWLLTTIIQTLKSDVWCLWDSESFSCIDKIYFMILNSVYDFLSIRILKTVSDFGPLRFIILCLILVYQNSKFFVPFWAIKIHSYAFDFGSWRVWF